MRAVVRTSSSSETHFAKGFGVHVADMVHAREEEEVAKAKTTPSEEVVLCKKVVCVSTEDPHIEAGFLGSGSRV